MDYHSDCLVDKNNINLTDAAYRFYRSKCEEDSISKRGLAPERQKKKRRHERLARVSARPISE